MLIHIHFRLQATIFDTLLITLTWKTVRTSPTVFLDLKNGNILWKLTDISFVSWDSYYIRSVCRHFEFVWAWLIILRHLRHRLKCAWASLPVGENRINTFQSVPDIQGECSFCTLIAVRGSMCLSSTNFKLFDLFIMFVFHYWWWNVGEFVGKRPQKVRIPSNTYW